MRKRLFMIFVVFCALQAVTVWAASFKDNGNGTVTDSTTGLLWQQGGSDGQGWNGQAFMYWADAISYCEGLSLGGQSDWRLPNVNELKSIVDTKYSNPTIDKTYFPNTHADSYWSSDLSSKSTYGISYAWGVSFSGGGKYEWMTISALYVRCVTDSPIASNVNNCAATLSSDLKLHIPIITFNNQSYWADLQYQSGSNFTLSNAGVVTDTSSYSGCTAATLSSDYKLHIPALTYNNASYWADFQYVPDATFTLIGAAAN